MQPRPSRSPASCRKRLELVELASRRRCARSPRAGRTACDVGGHDAEQLLGVVAAGSIGPAGAGRASASSSRATISRPSRMRVQLVDGEVVGQARDAARASRRRRAISSSASSPVAIFTSGGPAEEHLRALLDHHRRSRTCRGRMRRRLWSCRTPARSVGMPAAESRVSSRNDLAARDEHLRSGSAGRRRRRLHQVDQRQPVLTCDLVRAQLLSQRPRVDGAALDGRVVGADQALDAAHRRRSR